MITNMEFIVRKSDLKQTADLLEILEVKFGNRILRWFISRVTDEEIVLELTLVEGGNFPAIKECAASSYGGKNAVVSLIPTGIGCEIGGYAADAAPVTSLLASCADYLVTNPNAVNASDFVFMEDNILYTEGYMIDGFCKGELNLYKPYSNKVGVIIEQSGREDLEVILNIINTVRAVHGVDIRDFVITEKPVGGRCERNKSGAYVGKLDNADVLFKACEELISKGVTAIAVTTNIKDLPEEDYARHFEGEHPNPVGGAEAVISHLIGAKYRIPVAHAPLINTKSTYLKDKIVDARGAGEYASTSGLACILVALGKAPQVEEPVNCRIKDVIGIDNVSAVVCPATALGGIPVLWALKYNIPVIAVKNNKTILDVTRARLNLDGVVEVENYAEAAGILQALRKGISLQSIYRPLHTLRI